MSLRTARRAASLKFIEGEAESSKGDGRANFEISRAGTSRTSYFDRYYRGADCGHVDHIRGVGSLSERVRLRDAVAAGPTWAGFVL